jgi:hypothetical protein
MSYSRTIEASSRVLEVEMFSAGGALISQPRVKRSGTLRKVFPSVEHQFLPLKRAVILSASEGPRECINIPRQIKRQLGSARFFQQ